MSTYKEAEQLHAGVLHPRGGIKMSAAVPVVASKGFSYNLEYCLSNLHDEFVVDKQGTCLVLGRNVFKPN